MRVISGEARGHTLKAPKGMTTRPMADKIKGALYSMLSGILSSTDREWGQVLDMYAGSGSIGIEALSRGATWADFVEVNAGVCRVIADNLEHTKFAEKARINNRNVSAFLNHPPGPPTKSASKRSAGGLHRRKGGKDREKELPVVETTSFMVAAVEQSNIEKPELEESFSMESVQSNGSDLWQYDIIFLDPPYADPKIPSTIEHVARSGLVKPGGLVVIGHSPRVNLANSYGQIGEKPGALVVNLLRHRRHGDSAFSIYLGGNLADWNLEKDQEFDIHSDEDNGNDSEIVYISDGHALPQSNELGNAAEGE